MPGTVDLQTRNPVTHFKCQRFESQEGWRLRDVCISESGNIAVSGGNIYTFQTFIEVFSGQNEMANKPKVLYMEEFEKYETKERIYYLRYVSFTDSNGYKLVTGIGNKLAVVNARKRDVLLSRLVNGSIRCLFVKTREIYIGLLETNELHVYDSLNLSPIKSITLAGIGKDEFPFDMYATEDKFYVCAGQSGEDRPLSFDKKTGEPLSECPHRPTSENHPFARGVTANTHLGVVSFVWANIKEMEAKWQIGLYDTHDNRILMTFDVNPCVTAIRLTHAGDKMVTGNRVTGEVNIYVLAEIFNYNDLQQELISHLKTDDCVRLMRYFAFPNDGSEAILNSRTPAEDLLLALEERGAVNSSDVDRILEAFRDLDNHSVFYRLLVLYKNTRIQQTAYDRFLASISAHLTASLAEDLCNYFRITGEERKNISSSQNPGLYLLLTLDKISVIEPSDVEALLEPFSQLRLVQALAKIEEYQSMGGIGRLEQFVVATDGKRKLFIRCLQKKVISLYETMTPVPWKKSCKWKSTELFVGGGLILTNSKTKKSVIEIDEQCKLHYTDIFTHERLKSETRIIVEGDPGSGKTMLASQLAYDWAKGKIREMNILILLPLQFVGCKSLVESIKGFYASEINDLSTDDIQNVILREATCGFILDGLEENEGGVSSKSEVVQVMTKRKYPSCKAILTSRSEFTHDLPSFPMLKLSKFGDIERNSYIERVFSDDSQKQIVVKAVIDDNPFLRDLCSVPLLLVLTVHNFDHMGDITRGHFNKLTTFMQKTLEKLCPTILPNAEIHSYTRGKTSIEEIAFNGLCNGIQQLSWEKTFIEKTIANSKSWLDSGILIVDEHSAATGMVDQRKSLSASKKDSAVVGHFESASQHIETDQLSAYCHSEFNKTSGPQRDLDQEEKAMSDKISTVKKSSDEKQDNTRSVAQHVSLRVKFLHKIVQEWFAARYLSDQLAKINSGLDQQHYLSKKLPLINPTDLHHIMRFSCGLYPGGAHIIMNHLLSKYYSAEDKIPDFYLSCVFLCFAECSDYTGPDMLETVAKLCKENVKIYSEDSRLLQQAKVSMIKLASDSEIMINKVTLEDVVISATKDILRFNSGVTMGVLDTLHCIKINRWDQTLKEEDYRNVVKFVVKCPLLQKARYTEPTLKQFINQNEQSSRVEQIWSPKPVEGDFFRSDELDEKSSSASATFMADWMQTITCSPDSSIILNFPEQPPQIDKETLTDLPLANKTVTWTIGSRLCHTLNSETGDWQIRMKSRQTSEELSFPASNYTDLLQQPFAETEAVITRKSHKMTVPGTKVELDIPEGALPKHFDECLIKLSVLSRRVFQDPLTSFSSHSSLVVEVLPNNLLLEHPVHLLIPHCLILKGKEEKPKAKIFMSHHDVGHPPCWKEHPEVEYRVEETHCVVSLKTFCWVTIKVDDENVLAKKLILYTSGKTLQPTDRYAEVAVGYYPDLDVEGKFLNLNKRMIVSKRMPFVFMKDGSKPLCVSLEKLSSQWEVWSPDERNVIIPFKDVSASLEIPYLFILQKTTEDAQTLMCLFKAFQENGQLPVKVSICSEDLYYQHESSGAADIQTSVCYPQPKENTDNLIRFLSKNIREEWLDVGRCLHVSEAKLSSIKADNFNNQRECIYQMLLSWKEQRGSEATFSTLANALMMADRKDLAEYVRAKAATLTVVFE